jgi:hypothetical protein
VKRRGGVGVGVGVAESEPSSPSLRSPLSHCPPTFYASESEQGEKRV